jgi:hypothetical protein
VVCTQAHSIWRAAGIVQPPSSGSNLTVPAGTLCLASCGSRGLPYGPRAWMCDVDGLWRPAAAAADLINGTAAQVRAASAVSAIGQAGHLLAVLAAGPLTDSSVVPTADAFAVDCGVTVAAWRAGVSGAGTPQALLGSQCLNTTILPPVLELAAGTVCNSNVRTHWRGVLASAALRQAAAVPPFSTSPYAVRAWSRFQGAALRPVDRYRLLAVLTAVSQQPASSAAWVAAASHLSVTLPAACGNGSVAPWSGQPPIIAVMNATSIVNLSLEASGTRMAGSYAGVQLFGVSVAEVEAGVAGAEAESGVLTWDIALAVDRLAQLASVAVSATVNATHRHALQHALNDTVVQLILVGEQGASAVGAPSCTVIHLESSHVGDSSVRAVTGAVAASPAGVIADIGGAGPVRRVYALTTCATITLAPNDGVSDLLQTGRLRQLQGSRVVAYRRLLVGPAMPPATVDVRLSTPPAAGERVEMVCALFPPSAAASIAMTAPPVTITTGNYAATRGGLALAVSAATTLDPGTPLLAATILCNITSSGDRLAGQVYPAATTLRVPVLALSLTLPLVGDMVLTTRDARARSVWSTAALPLAAVLPNGTAAGARAVGALTPDVAAAVVRAVSIQPPPPEATFSLALDGSSTVVFVAATGLAGAANSVPSRFTAGTRVTFGGVEAAVQWITADGQLMAVTTPPLSDVCQPRGARGTCDRLNMSIVPPQLISDAEVIALAHGSENATAVEASLLSGARSLAMPLSCPPFCPGATSRLALAASRGPAGTVAGLPAPVAFAGRLLQMVPATSDAASIGSAGGSAGGSGGTPVSLFSGIAYVEGCSAADFEDPTSGVCTNASDPRALRCAYGA